jgi:pyruvate,water dikinase
MEEVLAAAGEAEPFTRAPLASRRRLAYELAVADEAPAAYVGDRPEPVPPAAALADGAFRGEGVCPGVAEGRVRHVRSLVDLAAVQAGDIVVVEAPKPAFTPAWAIAGGVVAVRGGALAPGLVLAREYGVPAVTGLPDALRLLPDGMRVRLDGFAGTVIALQPAPIVALP